MHSCLVGKDLQSNAGTTLHYNSFNFTKQFYPVSCILSEKVQNAGKAANVGKATKAANDGKAVNDLKATIVGKAANV